MLEDICVFIWFKIVLPLCVVAFALYVIVVVLFLLFVLGVLLFNLF